VSATVDNGEVEDVAVAGLHRVVEPDAGCPVDEAGDDLAPDRPSSARSFRRTVSTQQPAARAIASWLGKHTRSRRQAGRDGLGTGQSGT